jgi:phosphate transport system protein
MAERPKHISSSFDGALYGLKNDVLMMSSLTDRVFQTAFEALLKRDSELCDHVIADDEEIDILEKQVDQDGVSNAKPMQNRFSLTSESAKPPI